MNSDDTAADTIDLTQTERVGDLKVRLWCTNCKPSRTRPVRKPDDSKNVVRCGTCGKKHSTNSLEAIDD